MKRKAIEKIEPAKTRKKGRIATVQTLDDIAIINVFNDKVLAVRYCINCKTGEHEYWTEKNGWKKGKLITAIEGNWYEWVWMKHDYKYPKIDSEEDRKRLLDITQDKYCANEVRDSIGYSPLEGLDELVILENYIPQGMIGDQKKLEGGKGGENE